MIRILDCTLRDGGYVNNWMFGREIISAIVEKIEMSGTEIIELGFLKNEETNSNRTVFSDLFSVNSIYSKKRNNEYAVMVDAMNPFPIEKLDEQSENTIDIIRVMIWKNRRNERNEILDCLEECFSYCKRIAQKGYKICIQPARVDQYNDEEFVGMIKLFATLNPMAIYIVDSWGTLYSDKIIHYANLADQNMDENIALGYHGHNNMLQAFGTAIEFVNQPIKRDIIVDASIFGIGRGAGNLNLELILRYLNMYNGKHYDLSPLMVAYDKYINPIAYEYKWGYDYAFFICAQYNCNPNYALYLAFEKKVDAYLFDRILKNMSVEDRIMFSKNKADEFLNRVLYEKY